MSWLQKLLGGAASHNVTIAADGPQFVVPKGETILERALKQGIAYPHDCTVGTCGSCRSRLIAGKVEAITPFGYTLSREEMEAGYILACQAIARTDLTIEVDLREGPAPEPVQRPARLIALDILTHDIRRATFELDGPIDYVAGQYANFGWPGDSRPRSYSFSQRPLSGGRTRISTFVRRVPGGGFTEHLFSDAAFDTPYRIDGPHGSFRLRDGDGPMICIAGGSGLAPIVSLLEQAVAAGVRRDCILLFGARAERDLYARDDIAAIAAEWRGRFHFLPVLSEEANDAYRHGMVTSAIPDALDQLGQGTQAYLCGPPAMIDAAIDILTGLGVRLPDIHYDKFTDASHAAPASPDIRAAITTIVN